MEPRTLLLMQLMMVSLIATSQTIQSPFKRITAVVDGYPAPSPDGKLILFESNRTGNSELYIMDVNGKNLKQLTNNPDNDENPKWSPDGNKIVFASNRLGNNDIYSMNADGTNVKQLTQTPGDDSHPSFSPDGRYIIFNSARTSPDLKAEWRMQWHEIFTMKIDGSEVKQITFDKTISTYPMVSPDGKMIAYRKVTDDPGFNYDLTTAKRNSEVFVISINGTNPVNLSVNPAYDGWPTWTPDGKVVFSSNRGGIPYMSQLYRVNPDGTDLTLLTNPKYSFVQSIVSSDGRFIYCQHSIEHEDYDNGGIASIELNK